MTYINGNSRKERGFTLIELAMVVVIMGVLLAIVIPLFSNITRRAKTKSCQSNLRTLDGAIQVYNGEERKYPEQLSDLVPELLRSIPMCPVNRSHAYSIIGDENDLPIQARVLCGDNAGRGGIEDTNHFD